MEPALASGNRWFKMPDVDCRRENVEHAEDAPQSRLAPKDLRRVQPPVLMAQEVGEGLGKREDLLGALQDRVSAEASHGSEPNSKASRLLGTSETTRPSRRGRGRTAA